MNKMATIENRQLATEDDHRTAAQIRAQVNLIQEVMQSIMKENTHYGVLPGTNQPSLYKPGAEKIMATFRLSADPQVEDLSTHDEIRYRVKVFLISSSGVNLGAGIGECSTGEEKYKWRKAVCREEFDSVPEDRRRIKYARGRGGSHYTVEQIRTEPADLANTVLKMAKKRALVDAVLTTTAASDIFTQDIEDMPDEIREAAVGTSEPERQSVRQPQSKSGKASGTNQNEPATDSQKRIVRKKLEANGVDESFLVEKFAVNVDGLTKGIVNEVLAYIDTLQ